METAESILSTLNQPVLLLDGTFRPLFINPAFYRMLELTPSDLKEKFVEEFISGTACDPPFRDVVKSSITKEAGENGVETVCTLRWGKQLVLLVYARWMSAIGISDRILVEPREITKEKEARLWIQDLNKTLNKHVAKINTINMELESFSHSVSHDLRMPLRFVNRIAHLLLHNPDAPLTKTAAGQVSMILQATSEMAKMIENLLVFSQVIRTPLKTHHLDLRRLFQETAHELQYKQEGCNTEIVIEELAPCNGDRTLLKEVTMNLLTNALKFTRRREDARITIGCRAVADNTVYFVQDNGVGFDMRDVDALFLPFRRLHATEEFEGTGIGLALVKRIIERHGGRIWAESEVDQGATFFFSLRKNTAEQDIARVKDFTF